jgi:hypothetical protein
MDIPTREQVDRHFTWLVGIQVAELVSVVSALVGSFYRSLPEAQPASSYPPALESTISLPGFHAALPRSRFPGVPHLSAVTDGDDHVEVVVLGVVRPVVGSSYPEIPDNCLGPQLALLEDVSDVLADGPNVLPEQVGHCSQKTPDSG